MSVAAIRFDSLRKVYERRRSAREALKGISFEVPAGEIFGFLGPNGAGKTTAMHIVMDFIYSTSGSCEIFGISSTDPSARARVGFLPEIFSFDGFMRGEHFLRTFGKLASRTKEQIEAAIPELLEFLDMPEAQRQRIKSYSKGMTQKIGLAQALIGDPDLLILDEPTSGMDPIAKAKIKNLLKKLRGEGKTIFLSTHILSDIEDIADRVAIINKGEVLAVDSLGKLLHVEHKAYRVQFDSSDNQLVAELQSASAFKRIAEGKYEITCDTRTAKDQLLERLLKSDADITLVRPAGASLQHRFLQLLQHEELSDD